MKTVLFLHGWSHNLYYSADNLKKPFENCTKLIDSIGESYKIHYHSFPGFYQRPAPDQVWSIHDFSQDLEDHLNSNNIQPDFVVACSFGASVAVDWFVSFSKNSRIVLISPALIRSKSKVSETVGKIVSHLNIKILPKWFTKLLRHIFLSYIIQNPFYKKAPGKMKDTYLNIVKEENYQKLKKINSDNVLLIFGTDDFATPPNLLLEKIDERYKDRIILIDGGTHEVKSTHGKYIADIIKNFVE